MPVHVGRRGGKFRVLEPGGGLARNAAGTPVDGGGFSSEAHAARQARAINTSLASSKAARGSKRTLYVSRPLLNARAFISWARSQGFSKTVQPGELHVTLAFSREPVSWCRLTPRRSTVTNHRVSGRSVECLGDKGAVVLLFPSTLITARHAQFRSAGCSWDFPSFHPHVTITYNGADVDLSHVKPFHGPLRFGSEVFSEVDEDWSDSIIEKAQRSLIA